MFVVFNTSSLYSAIKDALNLIQHLGAQRAQAADDLSAPLDEWINSGVKCVPKRPEWVLNPSIDQGFEPGISEKRAGTPLQDVFG